MRLRVARCLALGACAFALGCSGELPPTGQVLLYIDTDAPLPSAAARPVDSLDPWPLFDTLLVEVFEPDAATPCAGCSRTFQVDADQVLAQQASFGVPTAAGVGGYRARVRLYDTSATLTGGVPPPRLDGSPPLSVVDVTVALPETAAEGIVSSTVTLLTDDVGSPRGSLDAPIDPTPGPPGASLVGSWPGALRVECAGAPAPGEVCVPGGAFWMGSPTAVGSAEPGLDWDTRRLVVLSPFFVDATEVTVAAYRAFPDRGAYDVESWSGRTDGSEADFCTFTEEPGARDAFPVLCTSRDAARAFCQWRGGDVLTEAQFEFIATGREGRLFVWGSDLPSCEDAVIARSTLEEVGAAAPRCAPAAGVSGYADVVGDQLAAPRRDRLELPTGTIYDLVGNASEWAADVWSWTDEPFWSSPGALRDPLCLTPSTHGDPMGVTRGGSFVSAQPADSIGAGRGSIGIEDTSVDTGFRCARVAR